MTSARFKHLLELIGDDNERMAKMQNISVSEVEAYRAGSKSVPEKQVHALELLADWSMEVEIPQSKGNRLKSTWAVLVASGERAAIKAQRPVNKWLITLTGMRLVLIEIIDYCAGPHLWVSLEGCLGFCLASKRCFLVDPETQEVR